MLEFKYKVKTPQGEFVEGTMEATHEDAVVEILHGKNYVILGIEPIRREFLKLDIGQILAKPRLKDIVIFTRQLSTLIEADMPLSDGLRTLAKQTEKPALQKIIGAISDSVEAGSTLSEALASSPKLFSPFYIKLVQSGEVSGKLQETLLYLADYLERTQAITSKIRGALTYPAFVVFALIVVSIIMVTFVLPQLLSVLKEAGIQDLPLTTRILLFVTNNVNRFRWPILVLFVGGITGLVKYVRSPGGKQWFDAFIIRIPVIGFIVKNLYLARIGESLSTLIKSSISILEALRITGDLVGNSVYRDIMREAEENVRGGGTISQVLSQYDEIPPLMSSMVAIGEKTGKLDAMLAHVSKFYKTESENNIQNLSQLIEPVLIFILGIGVAALVSGILLPIYSLVGAS